MPYKPNGKQSNATRVELFIALKYLIDKCPDEQHVSKTVELQQYARDNYSVELDRRRANAILESLVGLTNDYPDILPYKVKKIPNKERYFIEKVFLLNEKEIKTIANAVSKDTSLSATDSHKFIIKFLNKVTDKKTKDKIVKSLDRKVILEKHVSQSTRDRANAFDTLKDGKYLFYFRLLKRLDSKDCSNAATKEALFIARRSPNHPYLNGIIYDLYPYGDVIDVCIYLPETKGVFIVSMDNIELNEESTIYSSSISEASFAANNPNYNSIDEWVRDYYKGITGNLSDITFKFFVGLKNENLKRVSKAYARFFKKTMEYTLQDREVQLSKSTLIVQDAVVKVRCNVKAFSKWYWENGMFTNVVILEPAELNNSLLTLLVKRFERRLAKYGVKPQQNKEAN